MRKNKLGAMFVVSVLALTGIGITYAGFTDSISIYGTVNTATVDIDWIGAYSATYVWKVYDLIEGEPPAGMYDGLTVDVDNEIAIFRGFYTATTTDEIEDALDDYFIGIELVSKSYAETGAVEDVDMVYDNLFPCINFEADFIFHYKGSIPAKINLAEIFPITDDNSNPDYEFLAALWDMYQANPAAGFGAWVEAYRAYPTNTWTTYDDITGWDIVKEEPVDVGYQLHSCNFVYVKLTIHLPQDNTLQDKHASFGGNIGVIQWNEYLNDDCGTI